MPIRIDVSEYPTKPLDQYREYPIEEMRERVRSFYEEINRRRTVREFSDRPVPRDVIDTALKAANTAPSGANLQPWHFVVVSGVKTKKDLISLALKEFVMTRKRRNLLELAGKIEFRDDYDYKASRENR